MIQCKLLYSLWKFYVYAIKTSMKSATSKFPCCFIELEAGNIYLYLRCFLLMGPPEAVMFPPRPDIPRGDPGDDSKPSDVGGVFPSIASL
jgi:hypothetical protein